MDPDLFRAATRRALAAGFDGIQPHTGNGYLPLQFLSSNSALRHDRYDDSTINHVRRFNWSAIL